MQKAKDAKDCKREFHVQGACHPFHEPDFSENEGEGDGDYDDDGEIPSHVFLFHFKNTKSIYIFSLFFLFFSFSGYYFPKRFSYLKQFQEFSSAIQLMK